MYAKAESCLVWVHARQKEATAEGSGGRNRQPAIASPLVVYPGRVVVKRVQQGRLELDLHGVV